ncbi:MAG: hypothetical protein MZV63_11665 [Marinilabiliales bacterium]|nr:hypothetical protein [Marinilabiliales bacterium]
MLIVADFTKSFANDLVNYDSFSTVENLEAWTMVPGNNGYEKIPVTHFDETNDQDGSVFFMMTPGQ